MRQSRLKFFTVWVVLTFLCELVYSVESMEVASKPACPATQQTPLLKRNSAFTNHAPVNDVLIKSHVRAFEFHGNVYPDASLHIPTSFVAYSESRFYAFGHYADRVRGRNTGHGCQPKCSDAELALDIVLFANEKRGLTNQPGLQSLTSRNNGTKLGEGGYLFKFSLCNID